LNVIDVARMAMLALMDNSLSPMISSGNDCFSAPTPAFPHQRHNKKLNRKNKAELLRFIAPLSPRLEAQRPVSLLNVHL
jgi:hypothetical protein